MKNEIDEVICDVLQRREAKHDDPSHARDRHAHANQEFQQFCNDHLIPMLMEARHALLAHQIPAEVKVHPQIGFNASTGVALVIATHEFKGGGASLLDSTNRIFLLFELDVDEISLSVQVGGDNVIPTTFPPRSLPVSENSLVEIKHLIKEVVREAATIFFKV